MTTKNEPKKLGRPTTVDGRRRNVFIDDSSWDRAQRLGSGNASEGIRRAIEMAQRVSEP